MLFLATTLLMKFVSYFFYCLLNLFSFSGQPDGRRNENCVHLFKGGGFWNDIRCAEKIPFLCERNGNIIWQDNMTTTSGFGHD